MRLRYWFILFVIVFWLVTQWAESLKAQYEKPRCRFGKEGIELGIESEADCVPVEEGEGEAGE